ncbi:hypothetical protein DO97_16880 [Neosynechococcus sphagnicola sy1]|uniref:Uncharacterized protein n=2 Tax=Neosynechococcus TaxID=1501143 RepID=A0A098TMX1_9CYAN|nr:hypothetical protein DO97_16880 [Neosynechococcus sphagnicola sy1]
MLLAGASIQFPDQKLMSFPDPRASVFLGISPQGVGSYGLHQQSWEQINSPFLIISGTQDVGVDGQHPSWRLDPFFTCPLGISIVH